MSSGGISSMVTVAVTSARNSFFSRAKLAKVCRLLEVVAFLCMNLICLNSECTQFRFSCIGPPNFASIEWLLFSKMPLAAAITILTKTAPPPSLTFFRYSCAVRSRSSPSKSFLPRLLVGRATISSLSSVLCLFCSSSVYDFLIDFTVLSLICFPSFLKKCHAAAAAPCWQAYLAFSARKVELVRTTPFSLGQGGSYPIEHQTWRRASSALSSVCG